MINVILSFDDGRLDQKTNAFIILKRFGLRASFHITTGFVDGSFTTDDFGEGRLPLSIADLKEMKQYGMDISLHGDKHVMENNDFLSSYHKFVEWGICNGKTGFSVPGSNYTNDSLLSFWSDNKDYLKYIRVGRNEKCYSFLRKVAFVLYKLTKASVFFNFFNQPNLIFDIVPYKIYSSVVKNYIKPKSIISFIRKNRDCDGNYVLMFHSIVDKPNDAWEYDSEAFEEICAFLSSQKDVKVITLEDLIYEK